MREGIANFGSQRLVRFLPYAVIAAGWYSLAQIVLFPGPYEGRVGNLLYAWAYSQALALSFAAPVWMVWLLAYLLVAAIAAGILEHAGRRSRDHLWRRAFIAWLVLQGLYSLIAAALVSFGILVE